MSKARLSHNRIHLGEVIPSSSVRARRVLTQGRALRDGHGPKSYENWPSVTTLDAIFNPELVSHPGETLILAPVAARRSWRAVYLDTCRVDSGKP